MPRTLFIIPADATPEGYLADAAAAGATELVTGIPPALADELADVDLPAVYVEPDPEPSAPEESPEPEPAAPTVDPVLVEAWEHATTIAQLRAAGVKLFAALGVTT